MKKYHVSGEFLVDTSVGLALIPYFDNRAFFGGRGGSHSSHVSWLLLSPSLKCGVKPRLGQSESSNPLAVAMIHGWARGLRETRIRPGLFLQSHLRGGCCLSRVVPATAPREAGASQPSWTCVERAARRRRKAESTNGVN